MGLVKIQRAPGLPDLRRVWMSQACPWGGGPAGMQAIAWRNTEARHVAAEERRREAMSVAIPALSQSAARQLDTLRSLRQQGGD